CVAFGKTGENINQYLGKGDPLFVEGRLTLDQWEAQDGTKRSKHKVAVQSFQFIGGKSNQDTQQQARQVSDDDIPF
ncbi:MAG TPA: single-stranded DNA-binding protein, partial [Williamwhitmania sp.]|nr:single-stranded DNA-binding protein [Williamwhitmania sp.]